jgi:hypothetical protein
MFQLSLGSSPFFLNTYPYYSFIYYFIVHCIYL